MKKQIEFINELTKPIDLVINVSGYQAHVTARRIADHTFDFVVWAVYADGLRLDEDRYQRAKAVVKAHIECGKKKYIELFKSEHDRHLMNRPV
jgi:hypothetical protein